MGAENTNSGSKTYVNIYDGKFAIRCKEDTEGKITRINKVGKTVHELHYNTLKNMRITEIKKTERLKNSIRSRCIGISLFIIVFIVQRFFNLFYVFCYFHFFPLSTFIKLP